MTESAYKIIRSAKRKKVTITVERDRSIVVHAPQETSLEDVRLVVESKRQWILSKLRHPQKYRERLHPPGKELVNGESAAYLGRDYRIEIVETESGDIEWADSFRVPPAYKTGSREALRTWYLARAKEKILARVGYHARELGVNVAAVTIADSRYRWGSCTLGSRLRFNWRLIKAPIVVIDYVILHELAHLIESNHTERFWNIVRAKSPTTDGARTWLKEHGQWLEDEV